MPKVRNRFTPRNKYGMLCHWVFSQTKNLYLPKTFWSCSSQTANCLFLGSWTKKKKKRNDEIPLKYWSQYAILTYKFLSLMIDHIFLTTSGRGIDSQPTMSESSGLNLTALTPPFDFALPPPSLFLAGVPRFFLEAAFQSSSDSGSELSAARFFRPLAFPALRPFFFPPPEVFFPGLYSSSLPSSWRKINFNILPVI